MFTIYYCFNPEPGHRTLQAFYEPDSIEDALDWALHHEVTAGAVYFGTEELFHMPQHLLTQTPNRRTINV